MSFNCIHAILNNLEMNDGEDIKKYETFIDKLKEMLVLSNLIRQKCHENGAIEQNNSWWELQAIRHKRIWKIWIA